MNVGTADTPSALERLIRRDRQLMTAGLAAVTLLAWLYIARGAAAMDDMAMEEQMHAAMGMVMTRPWGAAEWLGLFVMWTVMMVAMMVPSAAPVMLLVLGTYRRRNEPRARAAASLFVLGYGVAWTMYSAVVSTLQVALHQTAVMTADMRVAPATLSGGVLLAVGLYQWLPVKNACLTQCRSPLGLIAHYWREGPTGGFTMGLRHGLFCIGCCCLLMAVLFIAGVMNLLWVAAIAALVWVEKLAAAGRAIGRAAGIMIAGWGLYLIFRQ